MKKIFFILLLFLPACSTTLKSKIQPPPDTRLPRASRIIIKGFNFKQHYQTGRETSYGPSGGISYNISKVGDIIAHAIGLALGFNYNISDYENFGDLGILRNKVRDMVEANDLSRSVVSLKTKNELGLKPKPGTIIFEGRDSNEAVEGATPFWWGVYNFFDYVTLLAFVGVPVHYEKEATVVLGIYNEDYERLGRFQGYARVAQTSYVAPTEEAIGKTLEYAYQDAVNTAAINWDKVIRENNTLSQ